MTRYIALLRGINVGGKNKIPMAELRTMLDGLGYTAVKTHLQSGNAVFTAERTDPGAVSAAVEQAIADTFGITLRVMVRTADELRAVVAANPLDVGHPSRFLVTFFAADVDPAALAHIDPAAHTPDRFAVVGREIYTDLPSGISDSKLPALLDRAMKSSGTARNWNTVMKLVAIADEA